MQHIQPRRGGEGRQSKEEEKALLHSSHTQQLTDLQHIWNSVLLFAFALFMIMCTNVAVF
jgi:hypothetical protein